MTATHHYDGELQIDEDFSDHPDPEEPRPDAAERLAEFIEFLLENAK